MDDPKTRIALLAAAGLLLSALSVHAAKWVNVSEGAYARSLYLDSDSLQRDGTQVQGWTREVFSEEQRSPHTGVLYYSATTLTRFECAKRTLVPLTRVFYGGDGTELRRISLHEVELPALVTPGSMQERLLDEACRPPSAKKPAPTRVAMADTKAKSDVPPGPAADPARDAVKSEKAEPKSEAGAAPKTAETKPPAES